MRFLWNRIKIRWRMVRHSRMIFHRLQDMTALSTRVQSKSLEDELRFEKADKTLDFIFTGKGFHND